ncbi:MAG: hypothetical protein A3C80_02375 [Candidatus Ryanbacteria bacterium RIFCSPHIGHO2_02_FULL_45_43]|uniref:dolichyl-phosphate beta-glucosyltransferase n=1 Tax=Candidatus Ryanbacteria bacterium RIFCSPHIGHO2_01_45_13 TaxID=1802112 RepID=A0A1G2FWN3_9BACT|nr:MAG: hypothetical protein A2718_00805 [Candidatus Ryanbacteria bacterium RIFCSPHIGHO2_01_FULL_44_130]OGZ42494.1 MAG: hypothetical protein A2W41_03650 [Candidatus Ryanbacteria bacterium RIFCSPHIGHO2_01_45_13]OGZ48511.1 MAG: hypothetical protein A3C80_02375 [Candidatus Ryanbacteria bacterium RIFCSPHIGHO2_02_FULL_45_43]OGZ50373.1 MAG: hypothetical protein A3E55_00275 [Candidatus Ryanbacteria bacterium RIFCSPHIGHO2_12_FULL_44_20]OGZ51715.1 MAG: hypothetical protein A3A17_02725 [Candidatus Ryanba
MYLSVIIPAYNEDERIEITIHQVYKYLARVPYTWEIIVVSDGSKDLTIQKVSQLAKKIPNVWWIDRKENRGKGYTVREGMLKANGRLRLFADADNSTDISHFDKMRPLFDKGYDVVICSRDPKDAAGARQEVSQQWHKRLIGNIGNLYIQLLAVRGIWDTQCGFKAFRADAAKRIFSITRINRWGFDVEVLALARAMKMQIGIVAAYWVNDPRSKVKLSGYLYTLWETTKIGWWIRRNRYHMSDDR